MGEIELVDSPEGSALAAGGLDFVEAEGGLVAVGEFAEFAEEAGEGDAMAAGALEGLDNDAGDFVGIFFQDGLDRNKALFGGGFVFEVGSGGVDEGEGDFEVAGDEAVEIAGDDGIVGELGDVERKMVRP